MLKEERIMKPGSIECFRCNGILKTITDRHLIFTRPLDSTWDLCLNITGVTHLKKRERERERERENPGQSQEENINS